ncbi:MAG TPA: EbsA family protein [Candidatus Ligilactobacillus excrementipullorum]|nr:EbsA family protein [Candidatus Ligilactobacillus excrementipullorum]
MKQRYSYQPDLATSVICWSFTGMIFLASMLFWLEITVIQPWTIGLFVIFVLVVMLQLRMRTLVFEEKKLQINKVIKINNDSVHYDDLTAIETRQHQLVLKTTKHQYTVLLKKADVQQVAQQLRDKLKH